MKSRYFPMMLGSLFAFTATGSLLLPSPVRAQEEGEQGQQANEDVEVLTRGPVHEAFAETVSYEAEAGLIVKSAPPAAIEELPPDQRPDGDNVTWIPGYWGWDDDQNDFLWISGVWRNIPPGRQWVPGYWSDLGDTRFQWVSGYWSDTTTEEVDYVQTAPPKSIDSGPNVAAPSDDYSWVPGNWLWNDSRYVWRPGYWLELRPNWTWVPARYSWSPRGYAYVDGYWDYPVANRGVLFAPVYYRRNVWASPGYYYTPSVVVSLNLLTDFLWVRPHHHHYYFGDYYAPRYADLGFYSSFSWHRHHRGYDPIWAYDRWEHRRDSGWERRYEDNFNFYRNNERFRPPHTWAAMRALNNERLENGRNRVFARNFDSLVNDPDRRQQFRAVSKDRREQILVQNQEMRNFSRQRRDLETKTVAATADNAVEGGDKKGVFREKLRRSPVMGRQADQFAKNEAPPKRPEGRGKAALKEAVAAAAGNPERGNKGRDLTPGQTDREGVMREKGQGQGKAGRAEQPEVAQQDRAGRGQGQGAEGKAAREKATPQERDIQPKPQRDKATQERQVEPKPQRDKATQERQVEPKPQREKATPERQVQPKQQQREKVAPERQVQPKPQREKAAPQQREVQPKRQVAPERKAQPQQQSQPRQPQVNPEKKKQAKDKGQASAAPQRRPEQSVQRIAQPKPQAQPRQQQKAAPKPQVQQRQAQPRQQQARPQVQQRQAQPRQQQAQPKPQQRQAQPRQQQSQPQQRKNKKAGDKKDSA